MMDDSIMRFTDKPTVAEAWRSIFPDTINANSKIALKLTNGAQNDVYILQALFDGLTSMNVGTLENPAHLSRSNFTIWERVYHLKDTDVPADYKAEVQSWLTAQGVTQANFPGITLIGCDAIHTHTGADAGACNGGPYADSLFNCDFLITFANVRSHGMGSVSYKTYGFKCHYGTYTPDTSNYTPSGSVWTHSSNGDCVGDAQHLRNINCTGPVLNKTRLVVFCSLLATDIHEFGGQPASYYNYALSKDPSIETNDTARQKTTMCNTLFMSTDPVTAEAWAVKMGYLADGVTEPMTMPPYLRVSAGDVNSGVWDSTLYNIGIMDFDKMDERWIVNGTPTTIVEDGQVAHVNGALKLRLFPNPANSSVTMFFMSQKDYYGKRADMEIYDAAGCLVWRSNAPVTPGLNTTVWHGVDNGGRAVSNGKYIARVSMGQKILQQVFSLVR
jgi:hypothetical protein